MAGVAGGGKGHDPGGSEATASDRLLPQPPWQVRPGPPRRTRRPTLDRERIVATALRIVDHEGLDALSLRRLAAELGVTPMSLYWYVNDKDHLLDLVGEVVLAGIELPPGDPRGDDWIGELRAIHRAMRDGLLRHPGTVELVIGRARYGPSGLALFERILGVLLAAGFEPAAAFDAYSVLYMFTLGWWQTVSRSAAFVEMSRQSIAYLRSLPADLLPGIAAVAPTIGAHGPAEQYDLGLDAMLDGLAARLAAGVGRRAS